MLSPLRKKPIYENTSIVMLPIGRIEPNPAQPRKVFNADELRELSHSIAENGVIQPITVRKIDERFVLVAGERRLRAAIMAGLREIPAIVSDMDERQSSLVALIENLQRCDLDFFEEALGIDNLIRTYNFSQEEAARKLGKSQSAVSNKLRLLKLPRKVIKLIIENNLTERHARALLRLENSELQESALQNIIARNLNVSQTDEYVERLLVEKTKPSPKRTVFVFKDVRPFVNTINHAVDTMRSSGIKADLTKKEDDSALHMTISIYKTPR
ncbi:MAG: ParB/RepB/Spo0J family partition protein [Clostridia bacterium]|nr:ParB/RepB/Spo0J family partition protein [Clostridia bacterium]